MLAEQLREIIEREAKQYTIKTETARNSDTRLAFISGANFALGLDIVKEMQDFISDIYKMWDCDNDAHKYNAPLPSLRS